MGKGKRSVPEVSPELEKELREHFNYDPITGKLFWKKATGYKSKPGREAGWKETRRRAANGFYYRTTFKGQDFFVHRLAWFLTHGHWPTVVDHVNGNGMDNRLVNLRAADALVNARNKVMHRKGKLWGANKHNGNWQASFAYQGKNIYVGHWPTAKEAQAAVFGYIKGARLEQELQLDALIGG